MTSVVNLQMLVHFIMQILQEGNIEEAPLHLPDFSSVIIRQGLADFLSIPLTMENIVLRGTRLKNTDYIFGIVVYTGKDTRLARNSEKSEAKFSTVERLALYLHCTCKSYGSYYLCFHANIMS